MNLTPQQSQELLESNQQAIGAWKQFAQTAPNGEYREMTGTACAFANVPLPFFNMAFLSRPATSLSDLNDRITAIKQYGSAARFPWMFFSCDNWLPDAIRTSQADAFSRHGLRSAMPLTGMVSDVTSLSAVASKPSLNYRRVENRETSLDICDLNCAAYGIPLEIGRESILESMFGPGVFAYVGYVQDKPVSAAGVWIVDNILYVAMVATHPDHQRKGYAGAVMRHSLQQSQKATGLSRTVLHATEAGFPVYQRMGYRSVARFTIYALPHE